MILTSIQRQKRSTSRYSVYVDGAYAFSLSADTLLTERLVVGQALDADQLKAYKKLSADDKAYNLTLAYLVRRQRSRFELTEYFRRKGYEGDLQSQIAGKLEALGLIDDERFAGAWIRNRRLLKPVSRRRLTQELRQKRIADELIEHALAEDTTDEQTVLRDLICRKRKQSKYQDDLKLMQYLARQGFSYDDIKVAMQDQA
jgi:regulatory protein